MPTARTYNMNGAASVPEGAAARLPSGVGWPAPGYPKSFSGEKKRESGKVH